MQARSSRCSPSITLWILEKGSMTCPFYDSMRSRLVPMPSNFLKKKSTFCKTKPPKLLRTLKPTHPHHTRGRAPLPFPTPNLSTAKRSAPTIQSAKGADPKEQIQIQSHPPDSHHKAVPLVMPHTNGLLPDPEILVLNISGSAEMIFCFEHFGLCIPGTEFSVHLPVIQYQTFRASGCFGANGHAQSWYREKVVS